MNIDNPIAREAFKKGLMEQLEHHAKYNQLRNYYYKRWVWVQFPWWSINVYENISEIMINSISLSSLS